MAVEQVSESDLLLFLKNNGTVVIGYIATKTKGEWNYEWVAEMQRGTRVIHEISPDFVKDLQQAGMVSTELSMHMNLGRQHIADYRVKLTPKGREKLRLKDIDGGA